MEIGLFIVQGKSLTILGGGNEIIFEHASHSEWFKESEWYKFKNL